MGVDRNDRRVVGRQTTGGEALENELLHGILRYLRALADICERFIDRLMHSPDRAQVALPLGWRPHRLEALDQVRRRYDLNTELTDQLDGAGINPGDVRDGIARRVLHRHPPYPTQGLGQALLKLLPGEKHALTAG